MSPAFVLCQVLSLQCGAAAAKNLFPTLGPVSTVLLRLWLAALILIALARPRLRSLHPRRLVPVALLGCVLAAMNLAYFQAVARLPLGIAAVLELLGPLAVATAMSRSRADVLGVALAFAGIAMIGLPEHAGITATGLALGLLAAALRAAYVLLNARVGRVTTDLSGLALAVVIGALVYSPFGLVFGRTNQLAEPRNLALGLLVAVLSSALPYTLDLMTLRRTSARAFGVLICLSPAVGGIIGYVALEEELSATQAVAIALITSAGILVSRQADPAPATALAPSDAAAIGQIRASTARRPGGTQDGMPDGPPEGDTADGAGHGPTRRPPVPRSEAGRVRPGAADPADRPL